MLYNKKCMLSSTSQPSTCNYCFVRGNLTTSLKKTNYWRGSGAVDSEAARVELGSVTWMPVTPGRQPWPWLNALRLRLISTEDLYCQAVPAFKFEITVFSFEPFRVIFCLDSLQGPLKYRFNTLQFESWDWNFAYLKVIMGFEWENHVVKFTGTPFRSPDRADGSLLLEVLTRLRGPRKTSIGSLAPRAVPGRRRPGRRRRRRSY